MTEKRFELKVNHNDQCDIVDWVESKEKNAICIYNDLGDYHFSSAKALCKLLNELAEENELLKCEVYSYKCSTETDKEIIEDLHKEYTVLERENKEFKIKNDLLSDELEQAKAVINKKWSEYLKKKME